MNIPAYVWKYGLILLFIREMRNCADLYLAYFKKDEENEELPDCVKHIYS